MVPVGDAERYVSGVKTEVAIARVRARVAALHTDLVRRGVVLVTVSERVPDAALFVIRPAGLDDDELAPENMILCDLDGQVVPETPGSDGRLPADAALHAGLFAQSEAVAAIVHAESGHAAAWAARGESVPCVTTAMADTFGGAVPVVPDGAPTPLVLGLASALEESRSPSVLIAQHGAVTVGTSARAAVRTALLLEDSARTAQLAIRGSRGAAPLDAGRIDAHYERARLALATATDDRR